MSLSALHADIAARYSSLNQAVSKGQIKPEQAAVLGNQYAYPVSKDSLGMSRTNAAQISGIDRNDFSIPFVISTQTEDRDGDVVRSLGGEVGAYAGNPVIFFGHQSWQIPIGVARPNIESLVDVRMRERQVLSRCWFDQPDEDAMFIFGKVERGILNAASVSFLPIQAYRREQNKSHAESMTAPGWFFERWELTEWSVVGIGANAGALRDSLDQEKSFIRPRLVKALQPFAAVAKGRCFSGYCPCPPCEEDEMTNKQNAATLTSGLPGAKACHKSYCTCKSCKSGKTKRLPEEENATSGAEAAGVHSERNDEQAESAEHEKGSELETRVSEMMPKLREHGYSEAQSAAIAYHIAGEGKDIESHGEVAMALGYKHKDDMGGDMGGKESMSLKSVVDATRKSIKKESEAEEKPHENEASEGSLHERENDAHEGDKDEEETEDVEEGPKYKASAKCLGLMHNHMKNAHDYLSKELPMMDHEKIAKAMEVHKKDLEGHMENYKSLADMHHGMKDAEFSKMCKSLGGEGGEAEEIENEDGAGESHEASSEEESGRKTDDESPAEKVEEYQHPKGAKKRVRKGMMDHGCVKDAAEYMAEAGRDATMPRVHKAAMMHHCSALTGYCKAMETPPAEAVEHGDPNEMTPEVKQMVASRLDGLSDLIFSRTGQRI